MWERKELSGWALWLLLLPASFFYRALARVRNLLYSTGWLKRKAVDRPVVSVGNLTVGGTGKTPTCIWLSQELARRGFKVAILSRGYKRKAAQPLILHGESGDTPLSPETHEDVFNAGDEPLMMARLYGQTVGIAQERYQAARSLLDRCDVDVFILDDGYQHRQLCREVDLLLLGADSTGSVVPAGPFREPIKAVRQADFYLLTGAEEKWRSLIPGDRAQACYRGALQAKALIGLESNRWKEYPLSILYRSKILAVTGIAKPVGFYRMIHDLDGEIVETLEFPDHHSYSLTDWQQINRMARNADLIVTTEKDILKLARFPFARGKFLALRVAMAVENGHALVDAIVNRIQSKH